MAPATRRTSAQIKIAVLDARQAADAREADVTAAGSAYTASLDQGRDAALAARARLSEAEVDRDIALHLVERLSKDLGNARKAEAEAEAEASFQSAVAAQQAFQVALERDLPSITDLAHGLLRLEAEALLADEAARVALSNVGGDAAANRLPPVDDFRVRYGDADEVVSRTVRQLWVNAAGQPPSDEFQQLIKRQPDGTGRLQHHGSATIFHHQREFATIEFKRGEPAKHPGRLAETLAIPGLRGDDEPGWRPQIDVVFDPHPNGAISRETLRRTHPGEVLARLKYIQDRELRGADEEADFRAVEIKFEPAGDLYEVSRDTAQQRSSAI